MRDIFKEETVEYVLALIEEMLTGNWDNKYFNFLNTSNFKLTDTLFLELAANANRARLFHDKSLEDEDIYEPFLR